MNRLTNNYNFNVTLRDLDSEAAGTEKSYKCEIRLSCLITKISFGLKG